MKRSKSEETRGRWLGFIFKCLLEGIDTAKDIANRAAIVWGLNPRAALNSLAGYLRYLEKEGFIEGRGRRPRRYHLTPYGAFVILSVVRIYNIRELLSEDEVLNGIVRQAPKLAPIVYGYQRLRPLIPRDEEEEEEESEEYRLLDGIYIAKELEKEELEPVEWSSLENFIVDPIVKFLRDGEEGEVAAFVEKLSKLQLKTVERAYVEAALAKVREAVEEEARMLEEEAQILRSRAKLLRL